MQGSTSVVKLVSTFNIIRMNTATVKLALKSLVFLTLFQLNFIHAQEETATSAKNSFSKTVDDKSLIWNPAPDFFPNCSFTVLHGDMTKPNLDLFFK